jgi:Zn finger protein HypA/HybF involved in hydrogenase expression
VNAKQDTKDCREEFRPVAARRRAMTRILSIVLLPAFGFWLLLWTGRDRQVGVVGFLVCWANIFIGAFALPKLVCPACHHKTEQEPHHFCPECGGADLDRNFGFLSITRCRTCGKKLVRSKGGRRYKIRFCPVCGAHLDDAGA